MKNERLKIGAGFTLIELLIVIVIIGILSAFGFNSYTNAQKRARDAQKKNDIHQYKIALENFSTANNNLYPAYSNTNGVTASDSGLCGKLSTTYLASCPANADYPYMYQSDSTAADGSAKALNWVLWVQLEASSNYWVVCANGKAGEIASGIPPTAGACPL